MLAARGADGVNVAVLLLTFTVPLNGALPAVVTRVKLAVFSVELVIASEKVAETEEFSATAVAAFAGDVSDTVGGVVSEVEESTAPGNSGGGSPAPPPQPNRLRLASRAAENMPAKILDLTFLPFDIREALRIHFQDHTANHMP